MSNQKTGTPTTSQLVDENKRLEREVEELRGMEELHQQADKLIEVAIRRRLPLEKTMGTLLPLLCTHVGGVAAWVRTFDERLEMNDFIYRNGEREFPGSLDDLYERIRKHKRYVRRGSSGWTMVSQVLAVAGEELGTAAVLLPERLERDEQHRIALRLNVWSEELDNHLGNIALARLKSMVTDELGDALRESILDEGLERAIGILHREIQFERLMLVSKHYDDPAGTSLQYKVMEGGALIADSSNPKDPVLDGLIRAEAVRVILGQPTLVLDKLGFTSWREEALIIGVRNQQLVGRIVVCGKHGEFNTFDRDLLARFADYIRLRIGDFNREWKHLSYTFPAATIKRLLRTQNYRTALLTPRECEAAVLFADVSHFTELCEGLKDPTAIGHFIQDWSRQVVDLIWETDGVFDKMVGDCVIGLWGPPFFDLEPAEVCARALGAAKRIVEVTEGMQKRAGFANFNRPLTVSSGLNYCALLVGQIGPNDDYTAFSSGMNHTARLQGLAKPGEILALEAFIKELPDPDGFGELQESSAKNVSAPLRYRALWRR